MYQGYRNHTRSQKTVNEANIGGGISDRTINCAKGEESGRIVKIITRIFEEDQSLHTGFLTLVQQPGHEPNAFIQRSKLAGNIGSRNSRYIPTGDFEPITPSEALSVVFRSQYDYIDYAGKSAVRTVIGFFPEQTEPSQ